MKKIFTLLSLLFAFAGVANAQDSSTETTDETLYIPQKGDFIRIKSYNSANAYLGATNYGVVSNVQRAAYVTPTGDLDPATIFYYDGQYLINYSTGYYLTSVFKTNTTTNPFAAYNGISPTTATQVGFIKSIYSGTDGGKYCITFYGGKRYLYAQDDNYTDAGSGVNNKRYTFDIEKVSSLPLTITTAGYATLYAPCALSVPTGVTVYTVKNFTGTRAILEEVTGSEIPAGTGVVVAGTAGTYNFTILSSTEAAAATALTGSYPALTVDSSKKTFILANKTQGVGFYLLSSDKRDVTGFRAFYQPADESTDGSTESAAAAFILDRGATGIETAGNTAGNADAAVYDLSGRRVQKAAKGLCIQNGKKVYVK